MYPKTRERVIPKRTDSDKEKVEKLSELLLVFGRHRFLCSYDTKGIRCSCGWETIRSALKEL